VIAHLIMLNGAALILLAGIGVVRFDDTLARMHALTKATTLGVVLVLIGAAVDFRELADLTALILAVALQVLTSPVSAQLIGRATYRSRSIEARVDVVDELRGS
jgi:multicomponent Na+:H+ antiporter subunit G